MKIVNSLTLSWFLLFLVSILHGFLCQTTPVITVTHGGIERENSLTASVYWCLPNDTEVKENIVYQLNNGNKVTGRFTVRWHTGSHELPSRTGPHKEKDRYCADLRRGGSVVASTCESKVQWMHDRRDMLASFSLRDLIIPGTRVSASYTHTRGDSFLEEDVISRWVHSQATSIRSQLLDGIRYIDLQPKQTLQDKMVDYFIVDAGVKLISMSEVIQQIRVFLRLSKDIIIVAFRDFEGFKSEDDHLCFMSYLAFSLQMHAHPRRNWTYTLNEFWEADKRLVLTYDHELHTESPYMWPPIAQYGGDAQTVNRLHSRLDLLHYIHTTEIAPFAMIVGFDHSARRYTENINNKNMSLLHWAERLSSYIPKWYSEEWGSVCNILLVDYYETSGIIDIAVQLNEQRAE